MKRIYLVMVNHKGKMYRQAFEDKKMAKSYKALVENAKTVALEEVMLVDRHDITQIPVDLVTSIATSDKNTDALEKPTSPFPWTSHGHLVPGCDMRGWGSYEPSQTARCGGPGLCGRCSSEASKIRAGQK